MKLENHRLRPDRFRPWNNWVLVKPDKEENHLKDDKKFSVDTSFDEASHAARTGTVIAVPDKLFFHPSEFPNESISWDTDMELQVGDHVTYHFLSGWTAEEKFHERYFTYNNEVYYLIQYERIFTAKRIQNIASFDVKYMLNVYEKLKMFPIDATNLEFDIIPINGFVLVEPVKDMSLERYKSILEIPKKLDKYVGIVAYMGSLNRDYRDTHREYHGADQDNIKIGDLVTMHKVCDIPLEYPIHAKLNKSQVYYRVQRRYIEGVYE